MAASFGLLKSGYCVIDQKSTSFQISNQGDRYLDGRLYTIGRPLAFAQLGRVHNPHPSLNSP
jgi:hypothetical protein